MSSTPNLLDLPAAAERLGVSPRTVRRYIADGRLPAFRLGPRLIRIDERDVERLHSRIPAGGALR